MRQSLWIGITSNDHKAAAGSLQTVAVAKDPKASLTGNELIKPEVYSSGRNLIGPSSSGHDSYQGSPSNISGKYSVSLFESACACRCIFVQNPVAYL